MTNEESIKIIKDFCTFVIKRNHELQGQLFLDQEEIDDLWLAVDYIESIINRNTAEWIESDVLPTYSVEQSYSWCKGCKEYDTEKHCCHRYSSFIRESLQDNIKAVLEDIKAEIDDLERFYDNDRFSTNGEPMFKVYEVLEIIDKHISGKESE